MGTITMKHKNFGYLIGEGFRAVFKHGFMSFAAVCITVACLVIINTFALIAYDMELMVEDVQKQMRVVVAIDETYTHAEAKNVGSRLNLIENVQNAEYISREDALESFAEDFDEALFEGLDASSMRDQFVITLVDNALVNETTDELAQVEGVAAVYADPDLAQSLATIRNVIYLASIALTAVLFVVSLIIISNTIRLAMLDRREEIAIMKMVGATNSFIRLPFFIEGFLLGLFGAVISFFLEWGLYDVIRTAILNTNLSVLILVPFTDVLLPMIAVCGIAGFFIGIFGSLMSIRRFLKV